METQQAHLQSQSLKHSRSEPYLLSSGVRANAMFKRHRGPRKNHSFRFMPSVLSVDNRREELTDDESTAEDRSMTARVANLLEVLAGRCDSSNSRALDMPVAEWVASGSRRGKSSKSTNRSHVLRNSHCHNVPAACFGFVERLVRYF